MAHRRFFRAFSAHSGKPLRGVLGAHRNPGALPRAAVRAAKLARQQAGMNELQRQRNLQPPATLPPAAPRTNHYRQCHLLGEPFPSSRMTPGDDEVRRVASTAPEPIANPNCVYAHLGEPWPSTRWDAEQSRAATVHRQSPATRDSRVLHRAISTTAAELHRAISTTAAAAAAAAATEAQSDDKLFLRNYSATRMADRGAPVQVGTGIPMSAIGTEDAAAAIRAAVLLFAASGVTKWSGPLLPGDIDVNGGSKQAPEATTPTNKSVVATATPPYRLYLAQQVAKRAKQRQQQSQQTSIASHPANATAATHWGSHRRRFLSSSSTEADGDLRTSSPSAPVVRYGVPVALPYNSMVGSPGRKWRRPRSRPGWCPPSTGPTPGYAPGTEPWKLP